MKYFNELEKDAIERNIPVMQREGLEFMIKVFKITVVAAQKQVVQSVIQQ